MKFCGNCGAQLQDEAKFCASCGKPCDSTTNVTVAKPNKKKTKLPVIGATIVLIVILVIGFAAIRWYNNPEQKALRAVESGDYAAVQTLIGHNKSITKNEDFIDKVNKRIKELENQYRKEKLSYEVVCDELDMIDQLGILGVSQQMEDSELIIYKLYCERNLKTFYLCTSQVDVTAGSDRKTTTWDYDEKGRLIGYSRSSFDSDMNGYSMDYSYIYDVDGRIQKTLFESTEGTFAFFANYNDNLLMDYTGEIDGERGTFRFGYDGDGNMISIEAVGSDGYANRFITMSYYRNGKLREVQENILSFVRIIKYNENGKQTEMSLQYGNGDYVWRYVTDYDEQGKMTYQATYFENDAEPYSITRLEYDKDGKMVAVGGESDGNSYYVPVEWDESKQRATYTMALGADTQTLVQEYDEFGNCIRSLTYINDELQSQRTFTYTAVQLPPDYEQPDINDPQYMVWLESYI